MNRAGLYTAALLLPALSALPFAQKSWDARPHNAVQHTLIALSGTAAPAGGNYLSFSFINATLNARHEVAFDAIVSTDFTSGVFVGDGNTTSAIALGINPDPGAMSFGSVFDPFILSNGDVVFDVNDRDIFTSHARTIVPLVRDGDSAPGGGVLTPSVGTRAVNDLGAVSYVAGVSGSTATRGIFRTDGKQTVTIARDDISSPTDGKFTLFSNTVMNDRGQVAFFSEMTGGSAGFGIFRGEGADLTPVFVANQIAPGGAIFNDFGNPVINRHGQVAAFASLRNSASSLGLFVGDGTDAVAIALEGQLAPKGGSFGDPLGRLNAFEGPVRLNDRGEAAFRALLKGGTSTSGIFRGNGQRTTAIALAGTIAPGTIGVFESFDDFKLGIDGRVAFIGTLALGVGGVDASNNRAIWIGTSDEDLQLVVRTGDAIDGKVLTRLPQFGLGKQFDINENGVLWIGNFWLAKAVVFSRILDENE